MSQIKGLRLFAGCTTDIERMPPVGRVAHDEAPEDVIFEIMFSALSQNGTSLCFPCNCAGQVNLDDFTGKVKREYLYARAMIGLEYDYPVVVCTVLAW